MMKGVIASVAGFVLVSISFPVQGQGWEPSVRDQDVVYPSALPETEWALATAVPPGEILVRPERYQGRAVVVRAPVKDALSAHAFTIDEDHLLATSNLLVIVPLLSPYGMARRSVFGLEGTTVTVLGKVRLFDRAQFEREYDWFSINLFKRPDELAAWSGRPVVVARSVQTLSGRELAEPFLIDE